MSEPFDPNHLRAIIMGGLWKAGKKDLGEAVSKDTGAREAAERRIAEAIAAELLGAYDMTRKPDFTGPSASAYTRYMGG